MSDEFVLERFFEEAHELILEGGKGLLDLERDAESPAHLDTVFRAFHTLKGSSALFDIKPITRSVHAGEDLLQLVRNGEHTLGAKEVDLLLSVLDHVKEWLGALERDGAVPAAAEAAATELVDAARALAGDSIAAGGPRVSSAQPTLSAIPQWLSFSKRIPEFIGQALIGIEYTPEPTCFFAGDDPLRLMSILPQLLYLRVLEQAPDPDLPPDPFVCRLRFLAVSAAPLADLHKLLAYAGDQIKLYEFSIGLDANADVAVRVLQEIATGLNEPAAPGVQAARLASQVLLARRTLEASGFPRTWLSEFQQAADAALPLLDDAAVQRAVERIVEHVGAAGRSGARLSMLPQAVGRLSQVPRFSMKPPAADVAPLPGVLQQPAANSGNGTAPGAPPALRHVEGSADDTRARVYKVDEARIDSLLNLAGELLVIRNAFPYLSRRADSVFKAPQLAREIKDQAAGLHRIAENFHHAVMQLRIIPLSHVFDRFPRLVRDLSRQLDKQVALEITGGSTEADKSTVEKLADPLIHIVRNSLDHGLEQAPERLAHGKPAQGTLRIDARQERGMLIVTVEDDGRGIDPDKLRSAAVSRGVLTQAAADQLTDEEARALIFRAGFSTKDKISDLSGRGVGMDVVRSVIEACHGSIQLDSKLGAGTRIELNMPLSMAVTRVLIVETEGSLFGVPFDLVRETVHVDPASLSTVRGARVVTIRDRVVPLIWLRDALDIRGSGNDRGPVERLKLLLVRINGAELGIVVDAFHEAVEIMLRPLEGPLSALRAYLGSSLMGDGRALLVLNVSELVEQAASTRASDKTRGRQYGHSI